MFCEVERSYIEDGFNLYGLRTCVSNFSDCLDLILDRIGPDDSDDSHLTQSACTLYGLIHARYIITAHGLDAMYNKVSITRQKAIGGYWICSNERLFTFFFKTSFYYKVCFQGVRYLPTCTMRRSTGIAMWIERRNGSRYGKDLLPEMPMCIPSPTSSIATSRRGRSSWSGRGRVWNNFPALVSNDVQQFSPRPFATGLCLHSESIWLSGTHVGTATRERGF